MPSPVEAFPAGTQYETVAANQTTQVLGGNGAIGDYLEAVICVVATAAGAQTQIKDGGNTAVTILPASPGGGIGTYRIPIRAKSTAGAWQVTTGTGVSAIATGIFS